MSVAGMVAGILLAAGLALAVRALTPRRDPLGHVLRRTHNPAPQSTASVAPGQSQRAVWAEQLGARLMETDTFSSRLPAKDLVLLEMSPAGLLGRCALYFLFGLLVPQWFLLLLTLGGMSVPFVVPLGTALVGGAFFVFKAIDDVRTKARHLREEYRYYAVSLIERVALARASDAGAAEALARAASSGDGRAAVRIHDTLEHARLSGTSAWVALEQLGEDLGVPELSRPAASMALAGEERAAVYGQLEAQAEAGVRALLAARKAEANEATEKMNIPAIAIAILMVIFMMAPPLVRILAF
ncbi:hypothetical protein OHA44_37565 [Streptomyces sp. NBC_00144]|uniref:hypothetical protein n=1 Tax=Streptomyces sp. NBC_00144 TaxID=2975665 RepID=UPI00324620E1